MKMGAAAAVVNMAFLSIVLGSQAVSADGPFPIDCDDPTVRAVCEPLGKLVCFVAGETEERNDIYIEVPPGGESGFANDENDDKVGLFVDQGPGSSAGYRRYSFTGFYWNGDCVQAFRETGQCGTSAADVTVENDEDGSTNVDASVDFSECGFHHPGCGVDTACLQAWIMGCLDGIDLGSGWGGLEGEPPSVDVYACLGR